MVTETREDPLIVVAYGLDESGNRAWGPIWEPAEAQSVAEDAARDPAFLVVRIHDWETAEDTTVANRCPHPPSRIRQRVCQVCGVSA